MVFTKSLSTFCSLKEYARDAVHKGMNPRKPSSDSINECNRPLLIKGEFPLVQILAKRLTNFPIIFPSNSRRERGAGIRKRTELPYKFRHSPNHAMGFLSSCFSLCLPLKHNLPLRFYLSVSFSSEFQHTVSASYRKLDQSQYLLREL